MRNSNSGHLYGAHRVILPDDVLPLYAEALDNTSPIFSNECLVEVSFLALHPTYLRNLFAEANNQPDLIKDLLVQRAERYGKLSKAGESVGWAIGQVVDFASEYHPVAGLKPNIGDTLLIQSDLAALPLLIQSIDHINFDNGIVSLSASTFLTPVHSFLPIAPLPNDLNSEQLDRVAASQFLPLQFSGLKSCIDKAAEGKRRILLLGSSRLSLMAGVIARETSVFSSIYALDTHARNLSGLQSDHVFDVVGIGPVDDAVTVLDGTLKMTGNELVDLVIHATFERRSALSAILPLQDGGTVVCAAEESPYALGVAAAAINRRAVIVAPPVSILDQKVYQSLSEYFAKLFKIYPSLRAIL